MGGKELFTSDDECGDRKELVDSGGTRTVGVSPAILTSRREVNTGVLRRYGHQGHGDCP